jgi:hypothetical protein
MNNHTVRHGSSLPRAYAPPIMEEYTVSMIWAVGVYSALSFGAEPATPSFGYLYQPAFELKANPRGPLRPYVPKAGDIILESDDRLGMTIGHNLAKTTKPHHSLIVFQRADGGFSIVQAGGNEEQLNKVGLNDVYLNLLNEEAKTGRKEKKLFVRQRKTPITEEQSAALTCWAYGIEDRRFARVRLMLLMTPWRAKGPLRTAVVGKPDYDRVGYFCSEQVITAMCFAGLLDPELARPGATFPHDLFFGRSLNFWVNRGIQPLNCEWDPPARWTSCPN